MLSRFFVAWRLQPGKGERDADNSRPNRGPRRAGARKRCWCTAARCARGFGETLRGAVPHPKLRLSAAEAGRGALQERGLGFIYSRFANPTVAMFEERMRLLEGAEAARATATGMAAVTAALLCFLKAGDHLVAARALFGSCRYVVEDLCPRFGIASTLIDGRDTQAWAKAVRPNTKAFFFETPANPTLDLVDIAAVSRDRARGRRARGGRQRVCHAPPAETAAAGRRRRRLFRDQAHRRPGPLPRRHRAGLGGLREGSPAQLPEAYRALAQSLQRLGAC